MWDGEGLELQKKKERIERKPMRYHMTSLNRATFCWSLWSCIHQCRQKLIFTENSLHEYNQQQHFAHISTLMSHVGLRLEDPSLCRTGIGYHYIQEAYKETDEMWRWEREKKVTVQPCAHRTIESTRRVMMWHQEGINTRPSII